jgi:hypothetical protein
MHAQMLGLALKWIEVIPKALLPVREDVNDIEIMEFLIRDCNDTTDMTMMILLEVIRDGVVSAATRTKAEKCFLSWKEGAEDIDLTSAQNNHTSLKPAKRK